MSKGEEKIIKILKKSKLKFEREKSFSDLRKGMYRFDFFISNYYGRPCVIEFNGEQHYKRVSKFQKTEKEFQAQKERDRRKISYCLAKNIAIYVIPYWEIDNIENTHDLFQEKFRAKTRWHCDMARPPIKFDKS